MKPLGNIFFNKILIYLLFVVFSFFTVEKIFFISVFAENSFEPVIIQNGFYEDSDVKWSLNDEGLLIINGSGAINKSYNQVSWKDYKDDILYIRIEEGITSICPNAFSNCKNLKEIIVAGSVSKIGWNAFTNCSSLYSVTLNEGLKTIESEIFTRCTSLKNITIPNSVKDIVDMAFCFSSLTQISISCSFENEISYYSYDFIETYDGFFIQTLEDAGVEINKYHICGEWEITVEPTESSTGLKTRFCSCGQKVETENIPILEKIENPDLGSQEEEKQTKPVVNIIGILLIIGASSFAVSVIISIIWSMIKKKN